MVIGPVLHSLLRNLVFYRLKKGEDISSWCEQLVQEQGVLLLPAEVYDHVASSNRGHFRIGLGRRNLPECLQQLDAWLVQKYRE